MWKKLKDWFVNSGLYAVGGAVIGGIAAFFAFRRTNTDFDRLRADYAELERQFHELGAEIVRLGEVKGIADEQLDHLERKFIDDGRVIENARREIERGQFDIEQLQHTNQRLAEWIQRYGEEIKNLSSHE